MKIARKKHDIIALRIHDEREEQLVDVGLLKLEDTETGNLKWVDTSSKNIRNEFRKNYLIFEENLKQTLQYFTNSLFGNSKIRLRPSYFPFTEPSAEVDIYWGLETEADYRITKGTGWLEIMGCGMVDPNVLENCGIDPEQYSGYAFGMGIERIAMLLYQISDIRLFFENDLRFLKQFKATL